MYFVIEIQILSNGNPNVLHFEYEDRNKAFEKYHYVLAEAAVSDCLTHTCIILDKEGRHIARETFEHPKIEPEPETPTESVEA
jgi:hypothetical protein